MSVDLKRMLQKVAEEDYQSENVQIEERLDRYKSLILRIAKAKKWDFPVWVEGSETHLTEDESDLNMLERSNLIKGQIRYTERNAYREYSLTKKGADLAKRLSEDT
jgi:DNA-binding HxlR family transcriptional regulator